MPSERLEAIRDALETIRMANGGVLTRTAVVDAARSKRSPLHREFDWDDKSAAQKQRLDRAQELITWVVVTTVYKAQHTTAPMYVRNPRAKTGEQGHVSLTQEDLTREDARNIVLAEVDRCEYNIIRARSVAAVLEAEHRYPGLSTQLEQMLEALIRIRGELAA